MALSLRETVPWARSPIPELQPILETTPVLQAAWIYSLQRMQQLQSAVAEIDFPPEIHSLWLAGSFARLEAAPTSDIDPIVLTTEGVAPNHPRVAQADTRFRELLRELGFEAPKATGIYARPLPVSAVLDPERAGRVAEDRATYGTRMGLLWEAQPLWPGPEVRLLQLRVLDWFDPPGGAEHPHLVSELQRYYRSLTQIYDEQGRDHPGRWRLRTLKGRFSRQLWYAAGLATCATAATIPAQNRSGWWRQQLALTPLERLAHVATGRMELLRRVCLRYERFLSELHTPDIRERLSVEELIADESLTANRLTKNILYRELLASSEQYSADLQQLLAGVAL